MQSQLQVTKAHSGDFIFTVNGQPIQDIVDPKNNSLVKLKANKIPGEVNHLIIFGFDFGYTAEACLELYDNPQVYIYEPNNTIYKIAASTRTDLRGNKSVHIFNDLAYLETKLMADFKRGNTIYTIAIDSWRQLFSDQFKKFDEKTHSVIRNVYLSENSKDARYEQWTRNLLENLPYHVKNPDLMPLLQKTTGRPAIICSAGPSLSKNLGLLKKIQNKVIIIAVNTAYQALIKKGIKPHFVVAIESYNVATMFKNLSTDVNLLTPLVAHPELQSMPFRNHLTYTHAPSFYNEWSGEKLQDKVQMDIGGSVACSAFSSAYIMGANPIILIGQDLSFSKGKMYSAGTKYENEKVVINEEEGTVIREVKKDIWEASGKTNVADTMTSRIQYTKGWHGGEVATIDDFKFFMSWFESASAFIANTDPKRKIINATEGGVYLEGYEHIPLKKAIKKFKFLTPLNLNAVIDNLPPKRDFKNIVVKELERLVSIMKDPEKTTDDLREEISLYNAFTRLAFRNKEDLTKTVVEFTELLEETLIKIKND